MINETDSSNNKIQVDRVNSEDSIVQDNHSNNNKDHGQNQSKDKDNSIDKSHGKLDSSQQLYNIELNKIIGQENQVLLSMGSNNSTSVSANKHTGLTSTSTFLQGLFLQYLHKAVITILCRCRLYEGISTVVYLLLSLQISLQVSIHEDILHYLYESISKIVHLLLFLLTSLRCEVIQTSLLVSLRSGILQSSLLTSLQSKFIFISLLVCLWKLFLRCLYKNISTITCIHSKPEILLQSIRGFMSTPKQVKSKAPKSWLSLNLSLQSNTKSFYKFVTYYLTDNNYNIDIWNIRKQVAGYIMSLKSKRRMKLKAKGCTEGHYHLTFNNVLASSSKISQSNTHKGCCVLNTIYCNYKLRSMIGREDDSKITK